MIYKLHHKFLDTIFIFLTVLSTGGMLFVLNRNLFSIILFSIIFFLLLFGYKLKKDLFNASLFAFISIFFLGLINFYFAVSEQAISKYLFHFLTLSISFFFLIHINNNRNKDIFIRRFYFVLKLISIHAFASFVSYFFISNNLVSITSNEKEVYETFRHIFYYTPERGLVNIFGLEFCRNQGLFWEPGILQIYINFLFFIEAFIIKKNRLVLLLSAFLILTTYSTTGLLLLLIQLIVYLKREIYKTKIILPLIIILLIPIYMVFNLNIDEKLQGEKESSFQKRMFDLTQPFFIALEHPITGIGLDLIQFQKARQEFYISSNKLQVVNTFLGVEAKFETTNKGSSNSIMFLLACTGFPTTILFLYMFIKQQIITQEKWLFSIIIIISVMSEPLLLRPFFFLFIVSGFLHVFYKITSHKKIME